MLFILVLPFLLSIIIILIRHKPSEIITYGKSNYYFHVYSDTESGGKSTVATQITNKDELEITYTLSDYIAFPNISLGLNKTDYSLIDYSGYDYIILNIESKKSKFLSLQFNLYIDGYSELGKYETYLPVGYYLELNRVNNIYKIPISQFKPHTWWLSLHQVSEETIKNYSFESVVSMEIMNDPSFSIGVEDKITFKEMSFNTDIKKITSIALLVLGFYYLFYFTLMFIVKRFEKIKQNREKIILIPYQSADLPSGDNEEEIIENYICSNYCDPLLNIAMVEDATNISERVIAKVLKNKYNYSFPGFVNFIRITEAKKLLESTDKKILDIAMMVGYNSLGHFNRTFKKIENQTPREYKKIAIKN